MVPDSPATIESVFEAENTRIKSSINLFLLTFQKKKRFYALEETLQQLYHLRGVCLAKFLRRLIPEPYTYTFCKLKVVRQAPTECELSQ